MDTPDPAHPFRAPPRQDADASLSPSVVNMTWLRYGAWTCFAWLLVFCGTAAQPSPDLWWQLSGGRMMVEHGLFPRTDPLSFTATDALWLNHEWMAECWMYWLYVHLGIASLHVAKVILLFVVFWLVSRIAVAAGVSEPVAALAAGLAVLNAQWRFFFDVRPYLFTYLGVAAAYYCAASWLRDGRRIWLLILPCVFLLWANLHSGVIAGLALLLACCAALVLSSLTGSRRLEALDEFLQLRLYGDRSPGPLLLATVVSAAACIVNPYGIHILVFPFDFLGRSVWSAGLNEWEAPDLAGVHRWFLVYLLFCWACAWPARRRLGAPPIFVLAGFSVLACTAWRHLTLFAIVSVPVLAAGLQGLAEQWRLGRFANARVARALAPLTLAVGVLGLTWQIHRTNVHALSMEASMFPVEAVRFLQANRLPERMLNAYGWGGYFGWTLWPRYRVFMDGRANTLFPANVYRDYLRATFAEEGWEDILHRYEVEMIVLNQWESARMRRSLATVLPATPEWARVYADDLAEIYVHRTSPALSARARWWYPPAARLVSARELVQAGRIDEAEPMLRALVSARQEEARAHAVLGVIEARRQRMPEAEAEFRAAIALDPDLPEVHYNLGALLLSRGDRDRAIAELQEEVRVNPGFSPARERLDQLRSAR